MGTDGTVTGLDPKPNPAPAMPNSDAATFCQDQAPGGGLTVPGTKHWKYLLREKLTSLAGQQVTLTDAQGKIVALPKLEFSKGEATAAGVASGTISCTYAFTIDDLKSDSDFFTIEVDGVPGSQRASRAELLAGLTLTAG